jgi:diacylglycerol kinase family enzyme
VSNQPRNTSHNQAMSATAQKRIIVAVNPSASFGANKSVGATVVNRLKELGHDATMLVEKDYQKLIATAKATIASKPDALVVVGGDGMVNLGTNLVAGTTVAPTLLFAPNDADGFTATMMRFCAVADMA